MNRPRPICWPRSSGVRLPATSAPTRRCAEYRTGTRGARLRAAVLLAGRRRRGLTRPPAWRPDLLEQPGHPAVGQGLAAGLAGRAVLQRRSRGRSTSRTVSPQTGHGSPVRPCTRSAALLLAPSGRAAAAPRDRSTRRAACAPSLVQPATSSAVSVAASLNGRHLRRVQDLVGVRVADPGDHALVAAAPLDLPPLTVPAARRRPPAVKPRPAGRVRAGRFPAPPAGPLRRRPPGRFCVPASVTSKPVPAPRAAPAAPAALPPGAAPRQFVVPAQPTRPWPGCRSPATAPRPRPPGSSRTADPAEPPPLQLPDRRLVRSERTERHRVHRR